MSVRHAVQHALQTLQFPVKEKDNPCEQTVPKSEASGNTTCNNQERQQNINHLGALPVQCTFCNQECAIQTSRLVRERILSLWKVGDELEVRLTNSRLNLLPDL